MRTVAAFSGEITVQVEVNWRGLELNEPGDLSQWSVMMTAVTAP